MDQNRTLSASQSVAARVAGVALLLGIAIVIVANYSVSFRLIVPHNAIETARNISAHELLFRINIVSDVLYAVDLLVLLVALYVVLKPISHGAALAAAIFRLALALAWLVIACTMLGALHLLGDSVYLSVFAPGQLHSLAMLRLSDGNNAYYIGLPFWGLASTVCSFLWFKSRYIPRPLAAYGIIASLWCVFCALAFIALPNFDKLVNASLFDVPLVVFEFILGFWLLIKGVQVSGTDAQPVVQADAQKARAA